MKTFSQIAFGFIALLAAGTFSLAEIKTVVEHNDSAHATAGFKFKDVPAPATGDAATKAEFKLISGERDQNGGGLDQLHDGKVPAEEDHPSRNFFFNAGLDGGRLLLDLGSEIAIKQINTYSWHSDARAPQVYKLYASDGKDPGFSAEPKRGADLDKAGWKAIATVDTRPKEGSPGGQYGVSIFEPEGIIGKYRYVLLDVFRTETADAFGNTFYSEIDVIDRDQAAATVAEASAAKPPIVTTHETEGGNYQFNFDTTAAPDLTEWTEKELAPVVMEWYPKLVALLPSEGYAAPTKVTILFREGMGGTPASAGGARINCNIEWFRKNLKGEARGAVVHEMAHVVQQYGLARRNNPNATRTPGWLTEGIPDYLRWFLYEPQTKGADITARNIARAKYDGNYRITGNFLNWVTEKYDKDMVQKLNTAAREGKYTEEIWKTATGKTVLELGDEWKKAMEDKIAAQAAGK